NGDGQTTKVANQIIVALTIEAVGEALLYAAKAGADPAKVRQALMGGFASSRILEVHGERMVKRTFDPGFRIELHQKDSNLALASPRALRVSLPNTATVRLCQMARNALALSAMECPRFGCHTSCCRSRPWFFDVPCEHLLRWPSCRCATDSVEEFQIAIDCEGARNEKSHAP